MLKHMKLKSYKKRDVAKEIEELLSVKELEELTLFMQRKKDIGTKSDRHPRK